METSALVISLRRSTNRAEQVKRIMSTCPVPCSVWDATDGSQMDADSISRVYQPRLHRPYYPFQLSPGEIGCFMSHRRIWQKMVDESIPRLLIVEDDIEMLPNFDEALKHAIEKAPEDGYIQFQVRDLRLGRQAVECGNAPTLVAPTIVPLRTSAQLVTLGAARRLLAFSQRFDRCVDSAIQLTWLHGAKVLVSQPRSVIEVSGAIGGSTIINHGRGKPLIKTLRREFDRAIYRHLVAKTSRKHAA